MCLPAMEDPFCIGTFGPVGLQNSLRVVPTSVTSPSILILVLLFPSVQLSPVNTSLSAVP